MASLTLYAITFLAGVVAALSLIACYKLLRALIPTRHQPSLDPRDDCYQVLVLGDIGRSPRMQYHALSIAKCGAHVDLVGYKETARHPDLVGDPKVGLYALSRQPEWLGQIGVLSLPIKALWQSYDLFRTMAYSAPAARWIIIQNPPSIPTLHIAFLVSLLRGSKLLVDWHNYGHTIMSVGRDPSHPLVRAYKLYETFLSRLVPDVNLTVTDAMARHMRGPPFSIPHGRPIFTLHDRPAATFRPIESAKARKEFLEGLDETREFAGRIARGDMRLVVSSTSWTPDEDFGILLEALLKYVGSDTDTDTSSQQPNTTNADDGENQPTPLLVIITGKGPQKAAYEKLIHTLQSTGRLPPRLVRIATAWLSTRDYASLLACADLGVCLHRSSSGLDLPMKVVDMFGAGLPVAAYDRYESFGELVREGVNGCGFGDAAELSGVLGRLLCGGEGGGEELGRLRGGAVEEGKRRWDDEWGGVVGRVLGLVK